MEMLRDSQAEMQAGRVARKPLPARVKTALLCVAGGAAVCLPASVLLLGHPLGQSSDQASAPPAVVDPWAVESPGAGPVSSYVARASEQIDHDVVLDSEQFRSRLHQLDRQLRQLERPPQSIAIPSTILDDKQWRRDVAEIEQLLRTAQEFESPY